MMPVVVGYHNIQKTTLEVNEVAAYLANIK